MALYYADNQLLKFQNYIEPITLFSNYSRTLYLLYSYLFMNMKSKTENNYLKMKNVDDI